MLSYYFFKFSRLFPFKECKKKAFRDRGKKRHIHKSSEENQEIKSPNNQYQK